MRLEELGVDALAAARVTRLVTQDRITDRPRDALLKRAPQLEEFVTCPWCVGVWVAFGVCALRVAAPRVWGPLARALAVAHVVGLIDTL